MIVKEKNESQPSFLGAAVNSSMPGIGEVLILNLDVSPSMDFDDWKPSRLCGAKDACFALLDEKLRCQSQDYVGIVSFAGFARIVRQPLPIETKTADLKKAIQALQTYPSTDIGAGLQQCESIFDGSGNSNSQRNSIRREIVEEGFLSWVFSPGSRAGASSNLRTVQGKAQRIILLSDGASNCGVDPRSIAERLKNSGVEINCIGISGPEKKEEVDESLLKKIASRDGEGRPKYWFIGDRSSLIRKFENLANGLRSLGS